MVPVLFANDIYRFPNATYHVNTKNRSFVRYAYMLKKMGVKNHSFVLTLLDPRLVDVDPFNPRNQEERDMVSVEIALNPWYHIREVARTDKGDPVIANRGLVAAFWLFFNHVSFIHTQPRQTGKTLVLCLILEILANIVYTGATINVVTLSEKLRDETTLKLKAMLDALPDYVNQRTKRDPNVSEHIKIGAKSNIIRFWLPRADEPNAQLTCRGSSGGALFGDEGPFQANFQISWPAAQNSMGAEIKRLKREGLPFGEGLFTTAALTTTKQGNFVYDLIQKSAVFTEGLYDCADIDVLHDVIRRSGYGALRVYAEFNALQLGTDPEELRDKVANNTGDISQIAMELFNVWQTGGGTCPIPPAILTRMVNSGMDPLYVEIDPHTNFQLFWYVRESELEAYLKNTSLVMTLDMAHGDGGDDCSITIVNLATAEVVAAGTINVVNSFALTLYIAKFFIRMPKMVFLPEYKSLGVSVVHYLLEYLPTIGENPFERIFNWLVDSKDMTHSHSDTYMAATRGRSDAKVLRQYQSEFGFTTSAGAGKQSRHMLYNQTLRDFAPIGADGLHNRKLIQQISRLESNNGHIDHRKGEHDDAVIGWLLAGWFIQYANNKDYYSIDARTILSAVRAKAEAELDEDDLIRARENNRWMGLINNKMKVLHDVTDEYQAAAIEDEVRFLASKLDRTFVKSLPMSIDEMLENARTDSDSALERPAVYRPEMRSTINTLYKPFM